MKKTYVNELKKGDEIITQYWGIAKIKKIKKLLRDNYYKVYFESSEGQKCSLVLLPKNYFITC